MAGFLTPPIAVQGCMVSAAAHRPAHFPSAVGHIVPPFGAGAVFAVQHQEIEHDRLG